MHRQNIIPPNNNLMRKYQDVSAMRSIQNNRLLSNAGRNVQQPQQIRDPERIKEAILDQRRVDPKIDTAKFNRILNTLDKTFVSERERLCNLRTNQPYKQVLPDKYIKKNYETKEDLIVYKVQKEDKDEKVFEENAKHIKQAIAQHDKELTDKYTVLKKDDYKNEFEYNNNVKYNIKYDPTDFEDMKENIVDYYKKEQQEQEKNKKCVDDIIEKMISSDLNAHEQSEQSEQPEQQVQPQPPQQSQQPEQPQQPAIANKYLQRQKKI